MVAWSLRMEESPVARLRPLTPRTRHSRVSYVGYPTRDSTTVYEITQNLCILSQLLEIYKRVSKESSLVDRDGNLMEPITLVAAA